MIVTADWILPVAAPPIRGGAIAIRDGVIVEVGAADDVRAHWLDDGVEALDGCIIAPGFVNAHTHLALSLAAGLVPPGPFHPWLGQVTKIVLGLEHQEFGHSTAAGALECLRTGTTWVGDIVYGSESLEAAGSVGMGGVFFWEVLGLAEDELHASLGRRGYPTLAPEATEDRPLPEPRIRVGLSPHAPYTSGPGLIRATYALARTRGEAFAIHVSEAEGEVELLEHGTGPFTVQAERLAHGFETPGVTPIRYLDSLGVLDGATCIHAVQVTDDDIALLAQKARAVVLCPRSNAYLGNGTPPVARLREAGVTLAIGTDSSASNTDLDLFAEARAVRALDPGMTADTLLHAMTRGGAAALGLEGAAGELSPGASADLVAARAHAPDASDVARAFLSAGSGSIERVMSGGVWRVIDGAPTGDVHAIRDAAGRTRDHIVELLGAG